MLMGYLDRIDEYRGEMIRTLQELIAIPSVRGHEEKNMPFGRAVDDALKYMLRLGEEAGFLTHNEDNWGGHIDYRVPVEGDRESEAKTLGILVHLDVVPEGSDWDYPPYGGVLVETPEGQRIYGRGTMDDKGPTIAAFYAMKALKDEGFLPQKNIRMILGLDEETSWDGMKQYLEKVSAPDFSFTPDADFPVIHGEMGILVFELVLKLNPSEKGRTEGLRLRSIDGGTAANSVADVAGATIMSSDYDHVKKKLLEFKARTGYDIKSIGRGKSLRIQATGRAAHGATPWNGENAISILMMFLGELSFLEEDRMDFIQFYNEKIGFQFHGQSLNCGFSDDLSGKLILNVGMIHMDDEIAKLTINIRYPITLDQERVYEGIMPLVDEYGMGIVKLNNKAPIFVPVEDPLVQTLLKVYRKHTGDMESKPMVIGGGTYARAVPGAVAYGAKFPGAPEVQHRKNEYIEVDSLIKTAKIYADAIYELTKEKD
jgi:succinyl-diaminopimelate desuccinylase